MMHMKKRNYAIALFTSVLIVIVSTFATAIILRNLGWLVEKFVETGANDKFDFVRIFEQTKRARLSVHWFIPMLSGILSFLTSHCLLKKIKNKAARITLNIVIFVILLAVSFVCSLLMTRVNGIQFVHLLEKLLPIIDKL